MIDSLKSLFRSFDLPSLGGLIQQGEFLTPGLLDLLIFIAIFLGALQGFMEGAVKKTAGYIGFVLGLKIGYEKMDWGAQLVKRYVNFPVELEPYIGFAIVFGVIQVGAYVTGWVLSEMISVLGLGILDRFAGSALGSFRNAAILSLLMIVLSPLGIPDNYTKTESRFYRPVEKTFPVAYNAVEDVFPKIPSFHSVRSAPQNAVQGHSVDLERESIPSKTVEIIQSIQFGDLEKSVTKIVEEGKKVQDSVLEQKLEVPSK